MTKNEPSDAYWRVALLISGDTEIKLEAVRNLVTSRNVDEDFVEFVLSQDQPTIGDLFCVLWDREVSEKRREMAADAVLGRQKLLRNESLALVPVAPSARRWQAVIRAVGLGISFADLIEAARSVSLPSSRETLFHMACVAAHNSIDSLYDWAEDGASVSDLVVVAGSGCGKISAAAGEIALLSGDLSVQDLLVMTGEEFSEETRAGATLSLRAQVPDEGVL